MYALLRPACKFASDCILVEISTSSVTLTFLLPHALVSKFISLKRGTNSDCAISEATPVSTQSFLCCSPDGGPPDYIVGLFIYSVVLVQLLMDTAMLFEKLLTIVT